MALHSRFRAMRSKRGDRPPLPPVKPDNRQWETDIGNGFIRVDNGAPPARLPSEAQPVSVGDPKVIGLLEVSPPVPAMPELTTEPAPAPNPVNHNTQPLNWQREFGLGR
jgi:hypothetical protein